MDLRRFNENQKKAILHMDNPCMVIASAGSGKTSVLTYRVANLIEKGVNPRSIMCVTFTKKATDEMKERLGKIINASEDVIMGTFHSICLRMLKGNNYFGKEMNIMKEWKQVRFANECIEKCCHNYQTDVKSVLSFVSWQKNKGILPNKPLDISESLEPFRDELNAIYKMYEELKDKEDLLDFDDMLLYCYIMLKNDKNIRDKYNRFIKYILVDEYQDTSKIQLDIIRLLTEKQQNLFVVGDDYQAIYGWRGADVNIMLDFEKMYEGTRTIILDTNYRSSQEIVSISNELIKNNKNQFEKTTKSAIGFSKYRAKFQGFYDEDEEASYICSCIKQQNNEGIPYKDMAILYRTNARSRAIEDACIKNKIPYEVIGSMNFLTRREIMDITGYLSVINDINDEEGLDRIINVPNRYLGNAFIKDIKEYAENNNVSMYKCLYDCPVLYTKRYYLTNANKLYETIEKLRKAKYNSIGQLIFMIIDEINYYDYLRKLVVDEDIAHKAENISTFISFANKFSKLEDFLEEIKRMKSESSKMNSKADKVQLMTVHRAKGLEWDSVYFIGMCENTIPHYHSTDIEEERRIAYVGISRPKKYLTVTWSLEFNDKEAGASPFVYEIIDEVNEHENIAFL